MTRNVVRINKTGRVNCVTAIALPITARQAWGQLRDFHRYASHDPFHAGLEIDGRTPRAGASLHILHRYGPFRVQRIGKILRWIEGRQFAYSDLSLRGPRRGFPHVLKMTVVEQPVGCVLTIQVTGKWTAPTPRWITSLWLRWVMREITQRTQNRLLEFHLATRDLRRA
ncbi:hypothetical protein BH10PLA1_BH10PLA1_15680 [soil metagenome]